MPTASIPERASLVCDSRARRAAARRRRADAARTLCAGLAFALATGSCRDASPPTATREDASASAPSAAATASPATPAAPSSPAAAEPTSSPAPVTGPIRAALAGAYRGKNVLLFSWDTLRYDRLGVNGNPRPVSPNVDRWARDAVVFQHMYSVSSWTLAAHQSLMTSQFPTVHGVTNSRRSLAAGKTTLAELMKAAGYETRAFTGGSYVSPAFGFDQGFDGFETIGDAEALMLPELVDRTTEWLRGRDASKPFFAFLHSFDVHVPYTPPAEFLAPFEPVPQSTLDPTDPMTLLRIMNGTVAIQPDDVEYLKKLYEAEVRFVDHHLGRLLGALDELGVAKDTIVVILADHGESFAEHGLNMTHAYTLYEEVVHVPLLIKLPGASDGLGARRGSLVQMIDILPTVLELTGVAGPASIVEIQGRSLVPVLRDDTPVNAVVYAETDYSNHLKKFPKMFPGRQETRTRALRTPEWKYVLDKPNDVEELYHVATDPLEMRNVRRDHLDVAAEFHEQLTTWNQTMRGLATQAAGAELPPETASQLCQLGYLDPESPECQGRDAR